MGAAHSVLTARLAATLLSISFVACDAGSVKVTFQYPDGMRPDYPDPPTVKCFWVEARTDVRKPGRAILPERCAPFNEEDTETRELEYGSERVALAEVRPSADSDQVLDYGLSERFENRRGEDIIVPIFLFTQPPQPLPVELGGSLRIVTSTLAPGFVNRPDVELLLFAEESATHARVSNVVGLPEGKSRVIPLETLEAVEAPAGYRGHRLEHWNLEEAAEPCTDRNRCRREIFVSFGDLQGYYGPSVLASVILDQVAPSLIAELTTVSPRYAREESLLAINLTATETILEPKLALAQRVEFSFVRVSPVDDQPTATYTFTSSKTAGALGDLGTFLIRADLSDLAGNRARLVEVGTFNVDTVVPVIADAWVDPERINGEVGRILNAGFTINKAARSTVTVTGRPMDQCTESGRPPAIRVTCQRAMRGDEIMDGEESSETLSIDATDDAMNIARRVNVPVTFDFKKASVFATTFTPEAARDELVQLAIVSDEPLEEGFVPELHWNGPAAPFEHDPTRDGPFERYFVLRPPIAIAPGEYELVGVPLRDLAGNEGVSTSTVALPRRWLFDPDGPVIESFTVTVRNGAPVIPPRVPAIVGSIIDVDFVLRETNLAFVRVMLGARDITALCSTSGAPPVTGFHCAYTTTGGEYPIGVEENESVLVEAGDLSGARRSSALSLIWDYAPPNIQSLTITPAAAGIGATAQLTLSTSEALAPGFEPSLAFSPLLAFAYDAARSTAFQAVFQYSVPATPAIPSETYVLNEVRLRDVAGNESVTTGALASLLVDNVAPVIGVVTVDVGAAMWSLPATTPPKINGDPSRRVEVSFSVTELNPAADAPMVTIGAIDISSSCVPSGSPPTRTWRCSHRMTGTEAPGLQIITVQTGDLAQNSATDTTATVEFDFDPPRIVAGSESLQLVPSTSNFLTRIPGQLLTVQGMGIGTTTFVGFVLNEVLARDPLVRASPSALSFQLSNRAGSAFTYQHALTLAPAVEGLNTIEITATDEAGNTSVLVFSPPLPSRGLIVDSRPPSAPDTARFTHTRVPWGSDQAGSGRHAFVEGEPGAVEANARIVVLSTNELAFFDVLGTAVADNQGAVARFELDRTEDRAEIFVAVLDGAGNASPSTTGDPLRASRIRRGEEIFTLGGKVPGRRAPNPHDAQMFTGLLPTLAQAQEQTVLLTAADFARLSASDGQSLHVQTERSFEPIITPIDQPEPRSHAVMAYDSMRGRAVLFGGAGYDDENNPILFGDTWEWNGRRWFTVTPLGLPPPARRGASMVFDSARGVVLLFGGADASGAKQDSWTWDGSVWTEVTPAQSPPARSGASIAYDTTRGLVVLYGGTGSVGELADTWIWNGATWTEEICPPLGPGCPGPRTEAGMSSGSGIVLFGGRNGTTPLNDSWGHSLGWFRLLSPSPAPPRPAQRRGMTYVYDPIRDASVLFGGTTSPVNPPIASSYRNDTWVSGVEVSLPARQERPPVRAFAASTFDLRRGEVIVFGGADASGVLGDTWSWDGSRWRDITPSTDAPPERSQHAMAFDPVTREIVVLGGVDIATSAPRSDMWAWNGARWRELTPSSPPVARALHAMSSTREGLAMFGGTDTQQSLPNDLFFWNGTDWSGLVGNFQPTFPEARNGHAMVFDSNRDSLVLFGGESGLSTLQLDDRTWEWDRADSLWRTTINTGGIAARTSHAMAFDAARGRTVLFGGFVPPITWLGDLWEWNGTQWTQGGPVAPAPIARRFHAMAYDSIRGRVVVYGGEPAQGNRLADAWEWNGSSWVELGTILAPGARSEHALAFDPDRHRSVLFGGIGGDRIAWELDADPEQRPGARMVFDVAELGVDLSSLQALEVRAVAGGQGSTLIVPGIGTVAPGAELGVWSAGLGEWLWLGSNMASGSSPAIVSFTVSSSEDIAACFSPGERIYIGTRTATGIGNGARHAQLTLDSLELHLRYQHPN